MGECPRHPGIECSLQIHMPGSNNHICPQLSLQFSLEPENFSFKTKVQQILHYFPTKPKACFAVEKAITSA